MSSGRPSLTGSDASALVTHRRLSPGAVLWVIIVALMPVHRLILEQLGSWLQYPLLAFLVLCVVFRKRARPFAALVWIVFLVCSPVAAPIAGTASSVSASTLVGVRLGLLVGLTPFVLAYYARRYPTFLRDCCIGFLSVQSVSALVALLQAGGASVFGLAANSGRSNGLAAHPNVLGLMATLAILVCAFTLRGASGRRKLVLLCLILFNGLAVVSTGSLSSMLSLVAGGVVLVLCMRTTMKWIVALFVIALAASVVAVVMGFDPASLADPIQQRIDVVTGESAGVASLEIREGTYQYALDYISSSPVYGVGMDSMNQGTFDGVTVVHNYLLRYWYQGGLFFLLLILSVTAALGAIVVRALLQGKDALAASVIVVILVFAFTSAFFDTQQYWLVLLLAVASVENGAAFRLRRPRPAAAETG